MGIDVIVKLEQKTLFTVFRMHEVGKYCSTSALVTAVEDSLHFPSKNWNLQGFLCSFFDDFGNLAPRGRKGVLVPFLVAAERLLSNGLSTPVTVLNNTLLVN